MQCHKSFILENNFEASSKPELVRMLERYGYRALTLRLTGIMPASMNALCSGRTAPKGIRAM